MKRTDKEIKAAKVARTWGAVQRLRNAPHALPNDEPIPSETIEGLTGWLRFAAFKNMKMK